MMNQWINSARLNLESRSMRDRLRWPLLIASLPLWPILSLVAFGALARVKLGFWPAYDHPDPSTLHWPFFEVPMIPLLLLAAIAPFGAVMLAFRRWWVGHRDWWQFLLTVASFGILLLWVRFDPTGLFGWWAD
jgi:hypothetical protein